MRGSLKVAAYGKSRHAMEYLFTDYLCEALFRNSRVID